MKIFRRVCFLGSIFAAAVAPLTAQAQATMQMQMSPLMGSVPSGNVSGQPLPLSLPDAIDRGLHYNLAALSGTQDQREAAAAHLKDLSEMLPKVKASVSAIQQQLSLAAFGFSSFPGIPNIVGPFTILDARAFLTQSIFDRKLVHDLRESEEDQRAVTFANANTRELVVLVVANLYLQALADSSRIVSVNAQVTRAQALYSRANDLKANGVIAGIDLLRAQVELQSQQQRLLAIQNEFDKQKLSLARAIGIPLAQEIHLTDAMPQQVTPETTLETALQTALTNRADAKRAETLIKSAEQAVSSAKSENLPTLNVDADYGDIGRAPGNSHGTYSVKGSLNVPIFNANHSKSDELEAKAKLDQRRIEFDDLKSRIEMDVRSSFLDLHSSEDQVKVAQSSLELAHKELDQAQDRFESGVANNLEVVQAQEAVALADESLISGLYSLNVAKASLAHAMGVAEQSIKAILGGKQ